MDRVALIGVGQIGRGWAPIFANAGYEVALYDAAPGAVTTALSIIDRALDDLEATGMIASASLLRGRINPFEDLASAVRGAVFIQESVPENIALKNSAFKEIDACADEGAIIASSCSSLPPASFLEDVPGRHRCIIDHPCTPPHLIPVVEILAGPWTTQETIDRTWAVMERIGQKPVLVKRPVLGYAINRLHAVLCREAVSLVEEGVMSPRDVDTCIKHGVGLRWAFMGPLETMDSNSHNGFREYTTKFAGVYESIGRNVDYSEPWSDAAIDEIEAWRRSERPTSRELDDLRRWRDLSLISLAKLFRSDGPWGHNTENKEV